MGDKLSGPFCDNSCADRGLYRVNRPLFPLSGKQPETVGLKFPHLFIGVAAS